MPLDLVSALQTIDGKGRFILIDCLTIWLSNLMIVKLDVTRETDMLCEALKKIKAQVVLVSNEVGLGVVPANAVARAFRDEQGFLNQRIAEAADEVVFIAAGLPLTLKKQQTCRHAKKQRAKRHQTKQKSHRGPVKPEAFADVVAVQDLAAFAHPGQVNTASIIAARAAEFHAEACGKG